MLVSVIVKICGVDSNIGSSAIAKSYSTAPPTSPQSNVGVPVLTVKPSSGDVSTGTAGDVQFEF